MTRRTVLFFSLIVVALAAACSGEPVGRPCFIPGGQKLAGEECNDADTATSCAAGLLCQQVGPVGEPFKCQQSLENILASPALECQSRTCLHIGGQPTGTDMCTAECSSDDDCEKVPEADCDQGFVCAVSVEVGPFCCKKFCQCKGHAGDVYVTIPDGGLPEPAGCDSNNPINECCNLSGRRGRDDGLYPQCN